ncbi:MAG: tRNA 2-thiouridine(34) synthase MnmA [Nanoarchaeota archaeon]|nr:tRNA 2-thiouridine(34) synthase MnmA [Nanoarchaeota archaeon]
MKQKVLLAMSGGVDSSVAALLLQKKGYEVIGAFMKNWSNTKDSLGECAWRGERRFALKIAAQLDIPLITLDFEKQYKEQVVNKMFQKYKKGITPNPDIDCNQKIKFPLLIKEAKKRGIDLIATGHFVRKNKKTQLLRAKDESKDQSYFLYRIKKSELKHCLFPIGKYTKKQIREIAEKNNFPNFDKKSTVGICFIGKINLKKFLQQKIKPKKGKILDPEGNQIGEHDGIYYYTIGQRLGPRYGFDIKKELDSQNLGNSKKEKGRVFAKGKLSGNLKSKKNLKKWYVAKKDIKKNILIAAPEGHKLNFRKKIIIKNTHWIESKPKYKKVYARIRHVGELLPAKLDLEKNQVILKKSITGISQGQAIVLYKGKKCLGGGEIEFE